MIVAATRCGPRSCASGIFEGAQGSKVGIATRAREACIMERIARGWSIVDCSWAVLRQHRVLLRAK